MNGGKKMMKIGLEMGNLGAASTTTTTPQNSAAIFGPLEVVWGLLNPLT